MANKNNKIGMIILVSLILIGLLTTSILPFLQSTTPAEVGPARQPINVETLPSLEEIEKKAQLEATTKNESKIMLEPNTDTTIEAPENYKTEKNDLETISLEPNTDLLPELPADYKEPTQEELDALRKEYQTQ